MSFEFKDRVLRNQDKILQSLEALMATIVDVQNEVTAQTQVIGGVVTLLNGLSAQLKAALASGDPAALQKVIDGIDANTQQLAAAVAANTPATPPANP